MLNLDITHIDPSVIENQRAAMLAAGDARKTISMKVESIKALLSWCVRVGYLATNPLTNKLEVFKVTPKTKRRRLTNAIRTSWR